MDSDNLADYDGPDRVVSSIEYAEEIKSRPKIPKHQTGLKSLDEALDGFEPGELVVISGPTAMGKTLLCDTIMTNLRAEAKFSLFFTFEVSPEKIVQSHSTPDSVIFLPRQLIPMNMGWLRERILEAKLKYDCDAVFIDHLHYLVNLVTEGNMSLEIGLIMRNLKRLALLYNVTIFLVCHTAKIDLETEPGLQHLRDSSFTGQEADTVLIVYRRRDKDIQGRSLDTMLQGLATVKVAKARRSGAMNIKISLKKEANKLVESIDEPIYERKKSPKELTKELL